ncbi:MAG: hypothetical protein QF886_21940 [Planctomycetota bacterium]|jgi:hypothetical protein|nr:hypothetical protein [Planctomycetota bacterium]
MAKTKKNKKKERSRGTPQRIADSGKLWVRSLPKVAPIALLLAVPGQVISMWGLQGALVLVSRGQGSRGALLFWLLINVASTSISASCITSAMDCVSRKRKDWLGRGIRKSLRVFGWEILVTLQALIRAFIPFKSAPSGATPENFNAPPGTTARLLDFFPILSAFIFFFSKMGLRGFVAVLTSRSWHESATVARGHYIHIGIINLMGMISGLFLFGIVGNLQNPSEESFQWGMMIVVFLAQETIATLLAAYGLCLYYDLRGKFKETSQE